MDIDTTSKNTPDKAPRKRLLFVVLGIGLVLIVAGIVLFIELALTPKPEAPASQSEPAMTNGPLPGESYVESVTTERGESVPLVQKQD
jgi:hypothetical protein